MKKLFLFILLIAGTLYSEAQPYDFFKRLKNNPALEQAPGLKQTKRHLSGAKNGFLPLLKLDSVVIMNNKKSAYTYNDDGEAVELIESSWNTSTNEWMLSYKQVHNNTVNEYVLTEFNWDTITLAWIPYHQYTENTDLNGDLTEERFYQWNLGAGNWEPIERSFFINTLTHFDEIYEIWNTTANDWKPVMKTVCMINAAGYFIECIGYNWVDNGWELSTTSDRQNYTFDLDGRVIEAVFAHWNSADGSWENYHRYTLDFNALGRIIDSQKYDWNLELNNWFGIDRKVYVYNPDNILEEEVRYDWVFSSSTWKKSIKTVYSHNADGTLASVDYYDYSENIENWVFYRPVYDYTYSYTPEGKVSEKITRYWLNSLSGMVNYGKQTYAYDVAGNVIDVATYRWNIANENWYGTERQVKEYDLTVDIADLVYPTWESTAYYLYFYDAKLFSEKRYSLNAQFNDWQLNSDTYYYFSELLTSTNETHNAASLKLFPNPVGDLLTIAANVPRASSYEITDLNGRVLLSQKWNGEGIDVSQLIPGSYVIRLIEGNRVITGKFIKS